MENENNNYTFTPITEDNSVAEIKNDFFGGEEKNKEEVPPVLENVSDENTNKNEQIEITAGNNETEESNNPEIPKEPVEIKVPDNVVNEEEQTTHEESSASPIAETSTEQEESADNVEVQTENKEDNQPLDFFNVTEVPTQDSEETNNLEQITEQNSLIEENNPEPPQEPINNNEENATVQQDEKNEIPQEEPVSDTSLEEKRTEENTDVTKEKIVYGKKCPNCGEITTDDFCPNCGFLIE